VGDWAGNLAVVCFPFGSEAKRRDFEDERGVLGVGHERGKKMR
jgi:hypothetical protein